MGRLLRRAAGRAAAPHPGAAACSGREAPRPLSPASGGRHRAHEKIVAPFAAVASLLSLSRTRAESLILSPPAACRSLEKRGAQLGLLGLRKKKVFLLLFIFF